MTVWFGYAQWRAKFGGINALQSDMGSGHYHRIAIDHVSWPADGLGGSGTAYKRYQQCDKGG
jgi:hypothetical protein